MVRMDHLADGVNSRSGIRQGEYGRPVGSVAVARGKTFQLKLDVEVEVPLNLGERANLHGREVELQDEKRISERRRVPPDVGSTEQFVEAVLEVDVVVVREHGADNRLAEPLRTQEHGRLARLQIADVRRVVHEQAFADDLGPVDDAVWNLALVLHAA